MIKVSFMNSGRNSAAQERNDCQCRIARRTTANMTVRRMVENGLRIGGIAASGKQRTHFHRIVLPLQLEEGNSKAPESP